MGLYKFKVYTLIASNDLFAADVVAARYMGLNPEKIKYLKFFLDKWNVTVSKDIRVTIAGNEAANFFEGDNKYKDFYVVDKWKEIKF